MRMRTEIDAQEDELEEMEYMLKHKYSYGPELRE